MKEELEAVEKYMDLAVEFALKYGFQVVYAIIILIIGLIIARWLSNMVVRVCESRNLDITLSRFLANVVRITVIGFVLIVVLGKFGITMTPFIAAIGAVAFGSSLALAGLLSNYGAGLSIIITRPFVVDDTIQIQGVSGVVEEIGLAATRLSTEDGEQITIPNEHIVGEILINSFENKVVEARIGISYDVDAQIAIDTIRLAFEHSYRIFLLPGCQHRSVLTAQFHRSALESYPSGGLVSSILWFGLPARCQVFQ